MMKKLAAITTVIFFSLFTIQATAQDYDDYDYDDDNDESVLTNRTGLGVHVGHYQAEDADDGSLFFGAQLRARGNVLGAELSAEYRGDQTYNLDGGEVIIRQIPVTASALLFAPIGDMFAPYAVAGLGVYYTIYDYEQDFLDAGDEADTNFGYHLGLGADIAVSPTAAFNLDYRYLFLDGNEDTLNDKGFSGNVFTAGITFYF